MATKKKEHALGSDVYAHEARENFRSSLMEYERLLEFEYVFGEKYYLHRLSCILEALDAIWGLEKTAKEFTEFSVEIEKLLRSLDKKHLRSQRDQCKRRLKKYYRTNDEEALDLSELKGFCTYFHSDLKVAIDLLDRIIAC